MAEIDVAKIKHRSVRGVAALTSRMAILQIIAFLGTFLLTVFLEPNIFGIFYVVTAVVSFLRYFSDIGLAAALIQKPDDITEADLKTTFTIQQILVVSIIVIALSFSNLIADFFNLDKAGFWLFWALIIAFFFSSLKTIPSVILERRLDFNRLVIPEIVETITYYLAAIFLAWKGLGITSFTFAVLARGLSGLIVIYILAPWRPGLRIHPESARKLLSFGAPFQIYSFLALIKDDLMMIFLGKVLPFTQVGYIGWAKKWAEYPLRLVMDSIIKVTFPAYSRLQEHPEELKKAVEKALFFSSLIIFPALLGLALLIKPLVFLIPKYLKWEPALTSFYLFAAASILASFSSPLINAINAIGKIKTSLKLMILWTVLIWILIPILIFKIGFNGVALAQALIGLTVVLTIWVSKKYISFSFVENIWPPLLATAIMGLGLWFLLPFLSQSFFGIFTLIILGVIIYIVSLWLITRGRVWNEVKTVIKIFRGE